MKRLEYLLEKVYKKNTSKILKELSPLLGSEEEQKWAEWYKSFSMYVTYPDAFIKNNKADLNTLKEKLDYIKELGMDAIHILPFFESPMIDLGFDISNYKKVRKELGGNKALESLIKESHKKELKIFVDLVFNHVSVKHKWFEKAVKGNQKYRDYFIHSKEKPKFIKKVHQESGIYAEYEIASKKVSHRIIFPEFTGEIPHWVKKEDGYWYYHTFYPYQIDLNWLNPEVFIEFSEILIYWARKGLNFRLDAITFLGKDVNKGPVESHSNLHIIIRALNEIVKNINSESVFLVEAAQPVKVTKEYFGKNYIESELAYNFNSMNAIWSSILYEKVDDIWDSIEVSYKNIPDWAAWINFLRNHDELTLEFATSLQRENIYKILKESGRSFREGFGIAGRTASFLGGDKKRIKMSYALLASMPGNPAIIYGDELGKSNEEDYIESHIEYKMKKLKLENVKPDVRDINRGRISNEDILNPLSQKMFKDFAKIFRSRKAYSEFFEKPPQKIDEQPSIFAAKYLHEGTELNIYLNLTNKEKVIDTSLGNSVLKINKVGKSKNKITLGPYAGVWLEEV